MDASTITVSLQRPLRATLQRQGSGKQPRWRLDKDEAASVFTRMRQNLLGIARMNAPLDMSSILSDDSHPLCDHFHYCLQNKLSN